MVRFARLYDHTRLIDADSGGEGLAAQGAFRVGDANDFHAGVWPPTGPTAGATATQFAMVAGKRSSARDFLKGLKAAALVVEYAGISFVTPGHAYQARSNGASGKQPNTPCDWGMIGPPLNTSLQVAQALVEVMAYFAKNRTYSAGGIVQLTDIEAECDGLLNYDRVAKFSEAEAALVRNMSARLVQEPVQGSVPEGERAWVWPGWMLAEGG